MKVRIVYRQSNLSYIHSIQGSPAAASRKNAAHGACPCNKQLLQAATFDVLAHSMCKRAVEPIALISSVMRIKTDSKLQFQLSRGAFFFFFVFFSDLH
jgi:hypothetical protein